MTALTRARGARRRLANKIDRFLFRDIDRPLPTYGAESDASPDQQLR
jgi:hypothetical protein